MYFSHYLGELRFERVKCPVYLLLCPKVPTAETLKEKGSKWG